ncbi:MAG TPA: LuxR C-terminal-related transcriptional regulator [Sphingobium sp.]|uniref:response regulator transcription factor n=1 Tax=Sphingobium sp. TaxID=1912891 RepID=UPI002ED556D7
MPIPDPLSAHDKLAPRLDGLTPRERDVLDGVLRGLTNRQIGGDLGISHRTVEVHRAHMMRKLGARNLLELLELLPRQRGRFSAVEEGGAR